MTNRKSAWYIVNAIGASMTSHTSKPSFSSEASAKSYKKDFAHAPGFKAAKVVQGTSDQYGFITPIN